MSGTEVAPDGGAPAADAGAPSTDGGAPPAEDPPTSNNPAANGDAGPSDDTSGGAASAPADSSGASSSGDDGSDSAGAGSSSEATDGHHDWVTTTLGVDPRTYNTCDPADATEGEDVNATPAAQAAVGEQSEGSGGNSTGVGTGTSDGAPATPDGSSGDASGGASGTSDGSSPGAVAGTGASPGGDTPPPANRAPEPEESAEDKKERTKDAIHKLMFAKDEDMQKMSPEEKVKYVQDLLANGAPTPTVRAIQTRLYNNTDVTPEQKAADDARSDQVAADLAGDQDLQHARANWDTLSDADKVAALKKVVDAQSKAMGIPAPEIVVDNGMKEGDDTASGVYSHQDGKLHLNMDPDSNTADFQKALSITAHENTHHYQDVMMQRLKDGTLNPGDPEYAQAKLFAANNGPNGYIEPHEGIANYKNQPLERHAWGNGDKTAEKIVQGM